MSNSTQLFKDPVFCFGWDYLQIAISGSADLACGYLTELCKPDGSSVIHTWSAANGDLSTKQMNVPSSLRRAKEGCALFLDLKTHIHKWQQQRQHWVKPTYNVASTRGFKYTRGKDHTVCFKFYICFIPSRSLSLEKFIVRFVAIERPLVLIKNKFHCSD